MSRRRLDTDRRGNPTRISIYRTAEGKSRIATFRADRKLQVVLQELVTMKKPHVIIFSGYGLNTEDETKAAFQSVGATADIIHLNDIIAKPAVLDKAQIIVFPGGFSYGDDTGSGKAYGNRLKQHLGREIEKFLARDTLLIGICNGFQIITSAGILPGALIANDTA